MNGLSRRMSGCMAAVLLTAFGTSSGIGQVLTPPPAPLPTSAPASPPDAGAPSSRWPLRLETPDGLITIYQPQLRSFDGNQIKARAALSVVAPGQQDPVFGAMWMESRVSTDRVARTVRILDVTVTKVRFPGPGGVTAEALTTAMRNNNAGQRAVVLSLDQVSAMLQAIEQQKAAASDISTAPPKIIFVAHPAVLVAYDGQPRLMQVQNSPLSRAMNTPFFVVLDPTTKTYFLKGASLWYSAQNPLGPFLPARQIPQEVSALATSSGYQDPQAAIEGAPASVVEVITATEPAELIWTDGAEEMGTIPNTELLYVTNTPADVFLQIDTQQIFVLLSGRWYSAPNHNGPWTYVPPDKLPPDFSRIPPNSEKANVLASVAGTQQAKDAVADTYIPQTAAIDRHNFEPPPVQYDGDPNFQPIENSPVQYCANTPNSVLLVGGRYYCCHQAVWYLASSAAGPWDLCTQVPPEIYSIPPSCPDYAVRFCHVYDSTADVVYVGYTPGYTGCYPFDHVVVYGTGFHYAPWVGREYFPRPWTYGFSARYDAYSNHWGFEVGRDRGGSEAWFGSRALVSAGGYFGHGGYRPLEIRGGRDREEIRDSGFNVYERRHDVRRDIPARAEIGRAGDREGVRVEPRGGEARTIEPRRAEPQERNNVFAGPNGEVYRKTIDGWEERQSNRWVPRESARAVEPSREQPGRERPANGEPAREGPPAELNRDYRARVQGQQRTQENVPSRVEREAPRESSSGRSDAGESRGGGQQSQTGQRH